MPLRSARTVRIVKLYEPQSQIRCENIPSPIMLHNETHRGTVFSDRISLSNRTDREAVFSDRISLSNRTDREAVFLDRISLSILDMTAVQKAVS